MARKQELHRLVRQNDLRGVRRWLGAQGKKSDVDARDQDGLTPLMLAVRRPVDLEIARELLRHGADAALAARTRPGLDVFALSEALSGGDPEKVRLLLAHGADLHYRRTGNYDALVDAVHGRDVVTDARLLDLLRLLIEHGADLDVVTKYQESALRTLSRVGRFDAVELLLDAGADEARLQWTPLLRAVALGTLEDVARAVAGGADLEAVDWWRRTALLMAVQTGDVSKAQLLLDRGADLDARGHCGQSLLFYAADSRQPAMLEWALERGLPIEQRDDFDGTALCEAVNVDNGEAVARLLEAGANPNHTTKGGTVLNWARSSDIARSLLDAGADPDGLSFEGRRALLGLPAEHEAALSEVSPEEFRRGWGRRFGRRNPEKIKNAFWEGMIRTGIGAYAAAALFAEEVSTQDHPVWCAQRFGQSITFLPDGRIVQVAGEHEDFYDPDFCIYNDVFVHEPDGTIQIFGYPESVFPPTDFHTATLLGDSIYLVGSLGYAGARHYGETPVYRLDTRDFSIEKLTIDGPAPGWIYRHRAIALSETEIRIEGGRAVTLRDGKEAHEDSLEKFILDVARSTWRRLRNE